MEHMAGLDGCGKSLRHRDSTPNRPGRSKSLSRLRYPGTRLFFFWNELSALTAVLAFIIFIVVEYYFANFSVASIMNKSMGIKITISVYC